MLNIPVFVINLDKDKDRRQFMESQLKDMGINYEIIKAFYGNDEIVLKDYDENLSVKENGRPLTQGERGCAYSHRSIYEKMRNGKMKCALILEDDVMLPKNFVEILDKELNRENKNWEWLVFDYPPVGSIYLKRWFIATKKMIKENKVFFFYALIKFPYVLIMAILESFRELLAKIFFSYAGPKFFLRPLYHAGCYLITGEGAEKLLKLAKPIRFSADRLPNQSRVRCNLRLYGYVPLIVKQDKSFESNIT